MSMGGASSCVQINIIFTEAKAGLVDQSSNKPPPVPLPAPRYFRCFATKLFSSQKDCGGQ